jgi:GTP-binding protein
LRGDENLNTLYHLRFRATYTADRGRHGEGSNRTGRSASDLQIRVPLGTQVYDGQTGDLIGEVLSHDETLRVAHGGRGGRGNARFATAVRRAPREAERGQLGQERELRLELKLLADVGIVGLPNAGKSTLISVISAARPKVADYPFTTLQPQLGVVAETPYSEPFVVADLPGLIEGAAAGAGLGHQFLRHVERCRILLHLVDLADAEHDAADSLVTVEDELAAFDRELLDRPRLLVGTKVEAAIGERSRELEAAALERGLPYLEISSVTGQGIDPLLAKLRRMLEGDPRL